MLMGRLVSMTESGNDMLSFVLDSVVFLFAALRLLMIIMVTKSNAIKTMGIIVPKIIGVLS